MRGSQNGLIYLSIDHKQFSRYLHLKFEKEVIFLGRFSPYEIPESGDKSELNKTRSDLKQAETT